LTDFLKDGEAKEPDFLLKKDPFSVLDGLGFMIYV